MKKALFLTAICAALTACGGGSGGSNGGSDPAPSPTPTPTPTNVTCTLPSEATTATYYGASVYGSTATWAFTQVGNALQATVNGTQSTTQLSPTTNGCIYTASLGDKGVAATFNEYGIIATTLVSNGLSYPALAVSNPESTADAATAAKIGGTYLMVNYEQNIENNVTSYSSYFRQITVNNTLSNGDITGTLTPVPGTTHNLRFVPTGVGGFNMMVDDGSGYHNEAVAYFKTVGTETILILGVNSNLQGGDQAHGMWVGTNSPASSFNTGLYVDNGVDGSGFNTINQASSTSFAALSGTTIYGDGTWTIRPNTPTGTQFYSVSIANEPDSIGFASNLGLTAIVGQWGPRTTEQVSGSSPGFVFLLKPKQTQQ